MTPYAFRVAREADEEAICAFMRAHWDVRHPLLELPDFFDYYYRPKDGSLRFLLAEADGRLAALAGFLPASAGPGADVWVSLWVADPAAKGAGLELMAALPGILGCRGLACNNIRPETRPFYHFLGYTTGRVGHFYRLAKKEAYALARVAKPDIPLVGGGAALTLLPNESALAASGFVPPAQANPYKDLWYIARRYYAFPRQSYEVYAAAPPGEAPFGLLCTRIVPAAGATVLRIADYIGPAARLPELGAAIQSLMDAAGAEYAECYCAGISPQTMRAAGFAQRSEGSADVVPNYLSPPLWQNTEYYYFTSRPGHFTLFRADGDQDRPNIIVDS